MAIGTGRRSSQVSLERFPGSDSTIPLSPILYSESPVKLERLLGKPDPYVGNRTTRSPTIKQTTSAECQMQENTVTGCYGAKRRPDLSPGHAGLPRRRPRLHDGASVSAHLRFGPSSYPCIHEEHSEDRRVFAGRLAQAGVWHLGHPLTMKAARRATVRVWDRSFDLGCSGGSNEGSNPSSGLWSRSSLVR